MTRIFLYLAIIVIPFALSGQSSKTYIKAAEQYKANGYYNDAIDQYSKAIATDPQNGSAFAGRAAVYNLTSAFELAAMDYEKAAVFMDKPDENFLNAAKLYNKLNQYNKCIEAIERAEQQKSNFYEAYVLQTEVEIKRENYAIAKLAAEKAFDIKNTAYAEYLLGECSYQLGSFPEASVFFQNAINKDKLLLEAYVSLAKIQISINKFPESIALCNFVILNDKYNVQALFLRSQAYSATGEFQLAINDISLAISHDSTQTELYISRGKYYMSLLQIQPAINDYTIALSYEPLNGETLELRANAYEKIHLSANAISDYSLLLSINKELTEKEIERVNSKIYLLGKETNKPNISLIDPIINARFEVPIPNDIKEIKLTINVTDESNIKMIRLNNDTIIHSSQKMINREISTIVATQELDFITISAIDIYDNSSTLSYAIEHTEAHNPLVKLTNPVVGDDGIISLSNNDDFLYLEGCITDESLIASISIDKLNASFAPSENNPRFTAMMDISKKNKIDIEVVDIFGNKTNQEFLLRRTNTVLSDESPMGKTWVILIGNSQYQNFTNLISPEEDIKKLQEALSQYMINKIIVKQNVSKRELERFFSIDLRDLLRINSVNSLLIWFSGHGANTNGTGYWIPTDATRDDEFSYYNLNALKASLYGYSSLIHLLVISDACHTGPTFATALKGPEEGISCFDSKYITQKSAQAFSSSGEGYAYDNSFFTRAFVNTLSNNTNDCLTIDDIVKNVSNIMQTGTSQTPFYGRITGFGDQPTGTFFFVRRP